MKKILSLLVFIGIFGFSIVKADTFVFMNGTGFDPSYSTDMPRYAFLADGSGYDYKLDKPTTLYEVLGLSSDSTKATITVSPVVAGNPTPDPVQTPTQEPTINQPTTKSMITDNTLVPFNKIKNNYNPLMITFPHNTDGSWTGELGFNWNGEAPDAEVIFNGQTILNKSGNAIEFTLGEETYAPGARTYLVLTGPYLPNTEYSFTYNQGDRTITRTFLYQPGYGIINK